MSREAAQKRLREQLLLNRNDSDRVAFYEAERRVRQCSAQHEYNLADMFNVAVGGASHVSPEVKH